jgi:hypothetical protein
MTTLHRNQGLQRQTNINTASGRAKSRRVRCRILPKWNKSSWSTRFYESPTNPLIFYWHSAPFYPTMHVLLDRSLRAISLQSCVVTIIACHPGSIFGQQCLYSQCLGSGRWRCLSSFTARLPGSYSIETFTFSLKSMRWRQAKVGCGTSTSFLLKSRDEGHAASCLEERLMK